MLTNTCNMPRLELLTFNDAFCVRGEDYNAAYEAFAERLSISNLTHLLLHPLSAANVKILAKVLPSSCITNLHLSYSDFNAENTLRVLLDGVASSKVTWLGLNGCRLGEKDVDMITLALKRMKLTHLSLCGNRFNVADLFTILAATVSSCLKSLNISDNISDDLNSNIGRVVIEEFRNQTPMTCV
jgi:hypothetical protein